MTTSLTDALTPRSHAPAPHATLRCTAELIHALVQRVPHVGRARIVNLLYLLDLEARRWLGRPLTPLNYIWYQHGPFDSDVYVQLDQLCAHGALAQETHQRTDGTTAYRYQTTAAPPPGAPLEPAEVALVDHIAAHHGRQSWKVLRGAVCRTPPIEQAQKAGRRGVTLNMDQMNNEARSPGAELERVLRAITQVESGQGRSLQAIRAQHRP